MLQALARARSDLPPASEDRARELPERARRELPAASARHEVPAYHRGHAERAHAVTDGRRLPSAARRASERRSAGRPSPERDLVVCQSRSPHASAVFGVTPVSVTRTMRRIERKALAVMAQR